MVGLEANYLNFAFPYLRLILTIKAVLRRFLSLAELLGKFSSSNHIADNLQLRGTIR